MLDHLKYLKPEQNDVTREPKTPNCKIIIVSNVQLKKDKPQSQIMGNKMNALAPAIDAE